jgi:hypothetical protein
MRQIMNIDQKNRAELISAAVTNDETLDAAFRVYSLIAQHASMSGAMDLETGKIRTGMGFDEWIEFGSRLRRYAAGEKGYEVRPDFPDNPEHLGSALSYAVSHWREASK